MTPPFIFEHAGAGDTVAVDSEGALGGCAGGKNGIEMSEQQDGRKTRISEVCNQKPSGFLVINCRNGETETLKFFFGNTADRIDSRLVRTGAVDADQPLPERSDFVARNINGAESSAKKFCHVRFPPNTHLATV